MAFTEEESNGAYALPTEQDYAPTFGRPRAVTEVDRRAVFARDSGRCHVCGLAVPYEIYEVGHIIDRCAGGPDDRFNLVVMCVLCNRLKPVHFSRSEYAGWVRSFREEVRRMAHSIVAANPKTAAVLSEWTKE